MRRPVPFGKYLLLDRISVGGMAEVFQAKSFGVEGFERILAIKRILPAMAEDLEFITMFIDEAKIAGQLSHPNICQIFELGKIESSHFIAMEFVWGKDTLQIQNRFRRLRRRMPLQMAAFIAAKACEGLDYAHRKKDAEGASLGIIHRDVSPQNILVSYEGEVKIIDFGIAKAVSRSSKTQAGVLKGKFGYMSPEQVRGLPLDRRSDVFALGTILYEMCVGERLFTGESDFAVLEKVRNVDFPRPSAQNPSIPPELERIILKALTRGTDERYAWTSEMQDDLNAYLLAQDPPFSAREMSGTLKEMFAREYEREQKALDDYKDIDEDALDEYTPAGDRELAVSLLGAPHGPAPAAHLPAGSIDDGRTEIGQPSFDDIPVAEIEDGDLREIIDDAGHGEDGATRVFEGEGAGGPAVQPMPAEPTFIFNSDSGRVVHAPDQATVILTDLARGLDNGNGANRPQPAQGPTVIFDAAEDVASVGGAVSGTAPLVAPRPPMVKDMLIGVLLALVVILGVVLWRVFSEGPSTAPATVVVSTSPPTAADVLIDDRPVGRMAAGTPLTSELSAGSHRLAVVIGGGAPLVQEVVVQPGQVKVVSFAVSRAAGFLELQVKPEGTRVFVDGAEVSAESAKRPLELRAARSYEIRVVKEGFKTQHFNVELKPGERVIRNMTLESAGPRTSLVTDPAGAEVELDGEKRGVTPLSLYGLAEGSHRATFRLEGYKSRTRWFRAAPDKDVEINVRLAPSGSDNPDVSGSPKPAATVTPKPRVTPDTPKPQVKPRVKAAGGVGYLVANTTPWAKVLVDGKDSGRTTPIPPKTRLELTAGSHRITFVVDGKKFTFPVKISAGQTARLIKTLAAE